MPYPNDALDRLEEALAELDGAGPRYDREGDAMADRPRKRKPGAAGGAPAADLWPGEGARGKRRADKPHGNRGDTVNSRINAIAPWLNAYQRAWVSDALKHGNHLHDHNVALLDAKIAELAGQAPLGPGRGFDRR